MILLSKNFRVTFLARFIVCTLLPSSFCAWAENETMEFDSSFLMGPGSSQVDLSRYSDGNAISLASTMPAATLITIWSPH